MRSLSSPQDLLSFHDPALCDHLTNAAAGGFTALVWSQLSTLMSDSLPKPGWLQVETMEAVWNGLLHSINRVSSPTHVTDPECHPPPQLWDQCFTRGPDFLYFFVTAYFLSLHPQLMAHDSDQKIAIFLSGGCRTGIIYRSCESWCGQNYCFDRLA